MKMRMEEDKKRGEGIRIIERTIGVDRNRKGWLREKKERTEIENV